MSADPRFTIFAARAVFDETLTATDVRVLAALGTFTDRQGWCFPSQGLISDRIGAERATVNRSVKKLVKAGYVQAVRQARDDGGKGVSLYRVLMDISAPEAVEAAAQVIDAERNSTDTPHVSSEHIPMCRENTTHVSSEHIELTPLELTTPLNPPKGARGVRLPAGWKPRAEEIQFGQAGGLSGAEIEACAAHFRDHFEASSKANARKSNWDLAFRNWLRTAISDARRGRRPVVVAAAPAGGIDWPAFIARWKANPGHWPSTLGPKPDEPGYRGPPIETDLFLKAGSRA